MIIKKESGDAGDLYLPTGKAQEAQGYETYRYNQVNDTSLMGGGKARFPVYVEAATEVNKGQRRLMLKLSANVPSSQITAFESMNDVGLSVAAGRKNRVVSAHLVVTVDDELWQLEAANSTKFTDDTGWWDGGLHGIANRILARLLAIAGAQKGNTQRILDENSLTPLIRGLQGLAPLDVVDGEYGSMS